MSIFPLYKTPPMKPASKKLVLIHLILIAALVVPLINHQPGATMPVAESSETESAPTGMSESWSDEWYQVHKATSDRVVEEIQGF